MKEMKIESTDKNCPKCMHHKLQTVKGKLMGICTECIKAYILEPRSLSDIYLGNRYHPDILRYGINCKGEIISSDVLDVVYKKMDGPE